MKRHKSPVRRVCRSALVTSKTDIPAAIKLVRWLRPPLKLLQPVLFYRAWITAVLRIVVPDVTLGHQLDLITYFALYPAHAINKQFVTEIHTYTAFWGTPATTNGFISAGIFLARLPCFNSFLT